MRGFAVLQRGIAYASRFGMKTVSLVAILAWVGSSACGAASREGGLDAGTTSAPDATGAVAVRGDTWEWDGAAWTRLDVPGPGARTGHLMAAFEGKVVLFGGALGVGPFNEPSQSQQNPLADTWEFDGTTWTQVAVTGPVPSGGWGMVSLPLAPNECAGDCPAEHLVLFGAGPSWNETWSWDGHAWAQIDNVASPSTNEFPPSPPFGLGPERSLRPRDGVARRQGGAVWRHGGQRPLSAPRPARTDDAIATNRSGASRRARGVSFARRAWPRNRPEHVFDGALVATP